MKLSTRGWLRLLAIVTFSIGLLITNGWVMLIGIIMFLIAFLIGIDYI